jgi:hypothetical protein
MTKFRPLPILLVLLCSMSMGLAVSANAGSADKSGAAAAQFERGEYGAAYKQYVKLAKDGDAYAQYRVS